MASLFNFGGPAPEYVGVNGSSVPRRSEGSFFGLFPGTPDYLTAPSATTPPAGSSPNGAPPSTPCQAKPTGLEVRIDVPGLLHLHGAIALPHLQELAVLVVPFLVRCLEDRFGATQDPVDERNEPKGEPEEPSGWPEAARQEVDLAQRVAELEQRLYDRE